MSLGKQAGNMMNVWNDMVQIGLTQNSLMISRHEAVLVIPFEAGHGTSVNSLTLQETVDLLPDDH